MRRSVGFGLAALCLLSGSAWILDLYSPSALPGVLQAAVHYGVLCALFGMLTRRVGGASRAGWVSQPSGEVALWAAVLFALPALLVAAANGSVARVSGVLVFTLVPAVVVFISAQARHGFGLQESALGKLAPALAGVGGAALLLPFTLPSSSGGRVWLGLLAGGAIAAGVASVRLHRLLQGTDLLQAATLACGASAVLLGGFCSIFVKEHLEIGVRGSVQEVLRCVMLDGPVLLLTLWLLQQMKPVAFAARYLIVPLVTVIEGYILLRPTTTWTMGLGSLLLLGAAAALVTADSEDAGLI